MLNITDLSTCAEAAVTGAAGAVVAAAGVAGTAAGFTSSGIATGSLAAAAQSWIGNVAAGSVFAQLQSLGAVGGFVTTATGGAGLLVAGTVLMLTCGSTTDDSDKQVQVPTSNVKDDGKDGPKENDPLKN